ncbi:uncharacterized protein LOC131936935 [Physella acuta]|uniref:uncharacterized protein LOC131936935 n=1 Tax=Physella acuta TaxID=109671 RepID=UPI0027DB4BD2|nr:uncharacterized protein LOC131936935 [Physella acuta]
MADSLSQSLDASPRRVKVTRWVKVMLLHLALGAVLFTVGFGTVHWKVLPGQPSVGLWHRQLCISRARECHKQHHQDVNHYHRTIQAMETMALVSFIASLVGLLVYISVQRFRTEKTLQMVTALTCGGVVLATIGFVMFGWTNEYNVHGSSGHVGWSMGVAVTGAIFYAIG